MKTLHPDNGVIEQHLAGLPLFSTLHDGDRTALAQAATLRLYDRSEPVFQAGDPAAHLFAVVAGSVRIVRLDPAGHEKVLHLAQAPASFAELPVLTDGHYPAGAICNEPCTMVAVRRMALIELAERDSRFPFRLLGAAMARLHKVTTALVVHGQKSAVSRVAAYLGGLSEGCGCVELPGAKKDVANYLGLTPESFSRALATLRDDGAITVDALTVRIDDVEALERAIRGE